MPTAISNESPIPCCNGSNVAPVELARDFILRFNWLAEDGVKTRFSIAARRSERAFLLSYDEAARSVVVRSKVLYDGATESGRPFEQLSESDFANEQGVRAEIETPVAPDARFTVATIDGELIFAADDRELVRFSTDDLGSTQVAAISEPFVLLGAVAYARNLALFRDLHYSNAPKTPAGPSRRRKEDISYWGTTRPLRSTADSIRSERSTRATFCLSSRSSARNRGESASTTRIVRQKITRRQRRRLWLLEFRSIRK